MVLVVTAAGCGCTAVLDLGGEGTGGAEEQVGTGSCLVERQNAGIVSEWRCTAAVVVGIADSAAAGIAAAAVGDSCPVAGRSRGYAVEEDLDDTAGWRDWRSFLAVDGSFEAAVGCRDPVGCSFDARDCYSRNLGPT